MTIADFLLARIAEDEERASLWEKIDARLHLDDFRAHHARKRRAAECEAKRRIIELHHEYLEVCTHDVALGQPHEREPWPCTTMRALAAIYADHPDYRDEWHGDTPGPDRP